MREKLVTLLAEYGETIKSQGWRAGEPLIERGAREFPDFRRWATALGIMLRAEEILEELSAA